VLENHSRAWLLVLIFQRRRSLAEHAALHSSGAVDFLRAVFAAG
jgi:hypothetical protein